MAAANLLKDFGGNSISDRQRDNPPCGLRQRTCVLKALP